MLIKQLDTEFSKIREVADEEAKQHSEADAKLKAATESAQKNLEDAAAEKTATAQAVTEHAAEMKASSKTLKGLTEVNVDVKKMQKLVDKAETQLSSFRSGALAYYKELVELSPPAELEGVQPSPDGAVSAAEAEAVDEEGKDADEARKAGEEAEEEEDVGEDIN